MTVHHHSSRRSPDDGANHAIERQIAALAGTISISDQHRDQMLMHATDSVGRTQGKRRTAQVVMGLSLCLVLVSPLIGMITRVEAPEPQTAERVNSKALRHAQASRMTFDWALVDVFSQFREDKRGEASNR